MENMPPLPRIDPSEVTIDQLLIANEQLSKKIQYQNRVIEETLKKIEDAMNIHK